ncbi:MAG: pyridoxamine 5'-phosphate oxidase family protein [Deltaproteobacteria bacterium]|nr:MAG: pyridoxamine 5'-phosphate oxidase family protein [Deltaproteobacteria bacterium]
MELRDYFASVKGRGVLATADGNGRVDAAVYAAPHFMDDETIAFIMRDRLTHHNLQSNPYATYLFMEAGGKFAGKRLFLTKTREEQDTELLYSLRRKEYPDDDREKKFLVFFQVDKILPLIGPGGKHGDSTAEAHARSTTG